MSFTHWILNGSKPVAPEMAEARAVICAMCPMNESADLYESVVGVAARVMRAALRRKHAMKLVTLRDKDLHVCGACGCDLVLKVHAPKEVILGPEEPPFEVRKLPDYFQKLDARCWIRTEVEQ